MGATEANTSQLWPQPSIETAIVGTSKGPVEFAQAGDGPPILYFHGTGAGNDLVFPVEHRLLDDGFRLIVMNRPGYYATPLECGRTAAQCADLAAELLDKLGIEKAAIIGTSGGGIAAGSFASRHPHRSASLILQCAQAHRWDSASWLPQESRWLFPFLRRRRLRHIIHSAYSLQVRLQPWLSNLVLKGMCGQRLGEVRDDPATKELCRLLIRSSIECLRQPAGIRNDTDLLLEEDWIRPGAISCPTLVIHDNLDPRVPVAHAEWAVQSIDRAERFQSTGGGHLIWIGSDSQRMHETRVAFLRRWLSDSHAS